MHNFSAATLRRLSTRRQFISHVTLLIHSLTLVSLFIPSLLHLSLKQSKTGGKKKISSYMLFAKETRPKVIAEKPDLTFGEVGKELGARWRALSEEQKGAYKKWDIPSHRDSPRHPLCLGCILNLDIKSLLFGLQCSEKGLTTTLRTWAGGRVLFAHVAMARLASLPQ